MSAHPRIDLVCFFVLAAPVVAQSPLAQINGTSAQESLGSSVVGLGDVDGDSLPDFAVGSPFRANVGAPPGRVQLCKGMTAASIRTLNGSIAGDDFGFALAAGGDVDGDGVNDLLVGAPDFPPSGGGHDFTSAGYVERFSSATGALLLHVNGDSPDDMFGASVAAVDDVNGDGTEDFVVGSPGHDSALLDSGMLRLVSGLNGATLWSSFGTQTGCNFGGSVSNVGDVDGDGHDDLVCGSSSFDGAAGADAGATYLVSGATGAIFRSWFGLQAHGMFGAAVAGVGDIDGDGVNDVAIGAPEAPYPTSKGTLYVYSGSSAALIYQITPTLAANFGCAIATIGDLDGDQKAELAVGAKVFNINGAGPYPGAVWVLAGANGALLGRAYGGMSTNLLGTSVAGLGDVDGDGRQELVAGAVDGMGFARVLSVGSPMPPSTYCAAKLNSRGCLPQISASGTPTLTGLDDFVVNGNNVINQKPGLFIWGATPRAIDFQGGLLCVGSPVKRTPGVATGGGTSGPDCSGVLSFHFTHAYMQANGLVAGSTLSVQGWHRDTALPANSIGLTNGLFVVVSP
ncbi:MAG TPA: integrin alpha [Planctomycetota bacterium]|nr:integrin alpha [Planctomycetota bacterium]